MNTATTVGYTLLLYPYKYKINPLYKSTIELYRHWRHHRDVWLWRSVFKYSGMLTLSGVWTYLYLWVLHFVTMVTSNLDYHPSVYMHESEVCNCATTMLADLPEPITSVTCWHSCSTCMHQIHWHAPSDTMETLNLNNTNVQKRPSQFPARTIYTNEQN